MSAPQATLLIGPGCPHCATTLAALLELVKKGQLGRLSVINVAQEPEEAGARGVRSVPWLQLGPFELVGAHSEVELAEWAMRAAAPDAMAQYFAKQLSGGQLDTVLERVRREPALCAVLLDLLEDPQADISVRLGVSAVLEDLEGQPALVQQIPRLGALTRSKEARLRGDAAWFLGLTDSADALPWLEAMDAEAQPDVREIVEESKARLRPLP